MSAVTKDNESKKKTKKIRPKSCEFSPPQYAQMDLN